MEINIKKFNELSPLLLYKILQLRFNVFVLEQKSLYDEFDEKDFEAIHLFYIDNERIVAYMRVLKKEDYIGAFGRVVVDKEYRGKKIGALLVQEGIDYLQKVMLVSVIKIEAQEYLREFYQSFGFKQTSQPYDDCGVMHIDMTLETSK
jgi:ElaA protein